MQEKTFYLIIMIVLSVYLVWNINNWIIGNERKKGKDCTIDYSLRGSELICITSEQK